MSTVALRATVARGLTMARDHAAVLALFATALFLSALLLFSVQPIFAKMVLPKLGGSPAVWAVSMVFFQAVLLAGYGYAHLLNRHCCPKHVPLVHLCVMGAASLALPFGLPAFANEPPAGDAYVWLMGVLMVGVGLPFFAVSANAPLLQSWFARSGHPQASDPYFLYGASNFGSLIALLAYPIAIEPMLGLSQQAGIWTTGFLMLGMLIAFCGLLVLPAMSAAPTETIGNIAKSAAPPIAWSQCLGWVALAAVPSGLLVSFTSFVSTDIASAPFLWVIPLALFLATFIMVFRERPMVPHALLVKAQPALVALTVLGLLWVVGEYGWIFGITFGFASFMVTTLVCHKELYDQRPDSQNLTAFYMWMSVGGVVGGIFAALVAPKMFNGVYEFPLLLLAGLACRGGFAKAWSRRPERIVALQMAVGGAGLISIIGMICTNGAIAYPTVIKLSVVVGMAGAALILLASAQPLRQLATGVIMAAILMLLPSGMNFGFSERSFFGVHRVSMGDDTIRTLVHGTTMHGAMRIKTDDGRPVDAPLPATYYYPGGPMARGVDLARKATGKLDGGLVVASIGVGAGSMACYSKPGEHWSFYEIDPVVVKLATDPKLFTFFARCQPDAQFVMGDARLTLAKAPVGNFDYLLIDAFSSDSVPVHMLTREALQLYVSRLSDKGVLALHISNRHMDLVDVTSSLVRSVPGITGMVVDDKPDKIGIDAAVSSVVMIAKSPDVLADVRGWKGAELIAPVAAGVKAGTPWTDDYSNVLGAILKKKGW